MSSDAMIYLNSSDKKFVAKDYTFLFACWQASCYKSTGFGRKNFDFSVKSQINV